MSLAPGFMVALQRYIKQRTPTWVLGARPAAQATGARTMTIIRAGEAVSDGGKVYTVRAYTSDQLGAQGGPGLDDWLVAMKMPGAGKFLAFGHLAAPGDPANDFCPLVLVCDPPLGYPVGNIGLGPWASKTVAPPGYVYDGSNSYAHAFVAVDAAAPADVLAVWVRNADGTLPTDGSSLVITADDPPSLYPFDHQKAINLWTPGYGEFNSGVQTMAADVDPTDAIFSDPRDGYIYVRQDTFHSASQYRSNNEWWRLANLALFAGTDASTETNHHGLGDLGVGTDGSLWVCTAQGVPGTWVLIPITPVATVVSWTSSVASIASDTNINFDTNTLNDGFTLDLGTHPDQVVIPSDGLYHFDVTVETFFDVANSTLGQTGDQMYIYLSLNGTSVEFPANWFDRHNPYNTSGGAIANTEAMMHFSGQQAFAAGDVLTVPLHYNACTTNVHQGDCWLSIHKIG